MLDSEPRVGTCEWSHRDADRRHDLNWSAEILDAESVTAEERRADAGVDGQEAFPPAEGQDRNSSHKESCVAGPGEESGAGDHSRLQAPDARAKRPGPRQREDGCHVSEIEGMFLLLAEEGTLPCESEAGTDAEEGRFAGNACIPDEDRKADHENENQQARVRVAQVRRLH